MSRARSSAGRSMAGRALTSRLRRSTAGASRVWTSSRMSDTFLRIVCGSMPWRGVVLHLQRPAPVGLADRPPHRLGDVVGVHHHLARRRCAPPGRWSGSARSPTAGTPPCRRRGWPPGPTSGRSSPSRSRLMPTSTSNSPSRRSRRICTRSRVSHLRVQVAGPHPHLQQIVGEVLGHLLGERRHQHPLPGVGPPADLLQQVVDLAPGRLDDHLGVDQAGGPDDLLDHLGRMLNLPRGRGRRQEDRLPGLLQPLVEAQGPVVRRPRAAGSRAPPAPPCGSGPPRTARGAGGW